MSKNLTRKGLVLGTVLALGASMFAGTPASAAPTALYLDTAFGTSGTSQVGILGDYFTLASSVQGGTAGDVVKYYVEGVTQADISATTGRFVTDLRSAASSPTQYTAIVSRAVDNTAKTAAFSSPAWVVGSYYQFGIQLKTSIDATTSIKVTPFLDSVVADDKPGANELTGTPVTINFLKGSTITATPTLTTVTAGAVVKAAVALSGSVNTAQLGTTTDGAPANSGAITVDFKETGADWSGATAQAARWNITDGVVRAVSSTATATASRVYGATAKVYGTASASATAVTAAAGEVSTLTGVASISGTSNRYTSASGHVVRSGSGSLSVKATVAAIAGKSKAGQTVTFTLSEASAASLPAGATLVAGGKTLTIASASATETIDVDVKSAADGVATLKIDYTGVTDAKSFTVASSAKGATGTVSGSTTLTFTGQDSVATSLVDSRKSANSSAVYQVAQLGTFSVALKVVDQFGQTPTGSFRLVESNSVNGAAAIASPVTVTAGAATVAGTDASTADGTYNVTSQLQKLGADGLTWSDVSGITSVAAIKVAAAKTATTVTLTGTPTTTGLTRNGAALVAGDTSAEQTTVARTVAGGSTIAATITDSYGAVVYGAPVTFSAKGVLFNAGSVYSLDSITVYTAANGTTGTVNIYSNIVGDVTVSATSGSATAATQKYTFATPTTGGTAWTVTAPTSVLPGTTLKYSAKLTDLLGGKVDTTLSVVRITYTGPGYVTSTLPTDTDADGIVSFTVLLGAADTGTATVKLEYANTNGFEEAVDNDDVVVTSSITIGAAVAAAAAAKANVVGKTKAFSVSVSGNASAKNVVVKVAGKTVATLKGSASAKTYTVKATKGSKKVTVYVGGKLIATKTVSVK